jgi:H+/Cl- antiporter ClcA
MPVTVALLGSAVVVVALVAADLVGGLLVPLFSMGGLIGLVLAKSFLPSAPSTFVIVAGGCALLAATYATPATAMAVGFATLGWSASAWGAVLAVAVAMVASGRLPGQHVRS